MSYAIKIVMIGDLGGPQKMWETWYRRGKVPLTQAKHSQDFTALIGAKPTTYADLDFAEGRAEEIRKVCARLHESLGEDNIQRHFVVRVVPYDDAK